MPNRDKKRSDALKELYESEFTYVNDLLLWGRDFQNIIGPIRVVSIYFVKQFKEFVFQNILDLHEIHKKISEDLERHRKKILLRDKGSDLNLEYFSVYRRHINNFMIYKDYIQGIPLAIATFDKELEDNYKFKLLYEAFMEDNNVQNLGASHFIFRPSQKLVRYTLLIDAIIKNETKPMYIKEYRRLIQRIDCINKEADLAYGQYTEFT